MTLPAPRRLLLSLIGGLAILAVAALAFFFRPRPSPNILLITLDTTRADHLGCYGHKTARTPALDALAARGVLFERAYANIPLTLPSHASMLTGLLPPEHGVMANGQSALPAEIQTVAERLQERGYATAAFLAAFVVDSKFGLDQGFDVYDDDLSRVEHSGDELERYRDGAAVIDAASAWLAEDRVSGEGKPFFCWVHLYDPHDPYDPHAKDFADQFAKSPYDGEIAYVDRLIARLQDQLKAAGLSSSTLIVVAGDHGEGLGEHGEINHGYMLHNATLQVPLIIADPAGRGAGRRVPAPVSLVDVGPTLLDAAGAAFPTEVSGRSLLPALRGADLAPQPCFSMTDEPYREALWSPLRSLTAGRWKYVRTEQPELYDLSQDPGELKNLAGSEPEVLADLEEELSGIESRMPRRRAAAVGLSPDERLTLESMGYIGGATNADPSRKPSGDIKQMIVWLNRHDEAERLIRLDRHAEAAAILESITSQVPGYFRAYLNLGLCRMMEMDYARSVPAFQKALALDPYSDRAHDMLGFAYLRQGKLDLARREFVELLKVRPDSENGHLYLGEIEQRKKNFSAARQHYQDALRVNPRSAAAREALRALGP